MNKNQGEKIEWKHGKMKRKAQKKNTNNWKRKINAITFVSKANETDWNAFMVYVRLLYFFFNFIFVVDFIGNGMYCIVVAAIASCNDSNRLKYAIIYRLHVIIIVVIQRSVLWSIFSSLHRIDSISSLAFYLF